MAAIYKSAYTAAPLPSESDVDFSVAPPPSNVSATQVALTVLSQLPRSSSVADAGDDDWKVSDIDTSSPEQISRERQELIRRIPKARMEEIEVQVAHLKPSPENIQAFKEGKWTDPVFSDPKWAELAFKAYLNGDISHIVLQKVFLFASCILFSKNCGSYETHWLCNGGNFDDTSKEIFFRAFFECYPRTSIEEAQKKFAVFLSQIKQIDPFDTQFFTVKHKNQEEDQLFHTLVVKYGKSTGTIRSWERFSAVTHADKSISQVVCLPKIINLVFRIFNGPEALQGMPCFGFFKKENLSDLHYRPVIIPCPLLGQEYLHSSSPQEWGVPMRIDSVGCASPLSVMYHDIAFHVLLGAQMPLKHRKAFTDFAIFIKQSTIKENLKNKVFLFFLDKHFRIYGNEEPLKAFWDVLGNELFGLSYTDWDADPIRDLFCEFFTPLKQEEYSIPISSIDKSYMRELRPIKERLIPQS